MSVQFIDFTEQYNAIKNDIDIKLKAVFQKANFILGQEVKEFEAEFAGYCGAKYGVGLNSGTDALFLALTALDIGEGDEVILPSFTFIATALCVSYTGAKPVFVDVDEDTGNIDPQRVKKAITAKTKAILPVHLYGQPADIEPILAMAKERNIAVIEDAAQSHGAMYQGKKVGSLGDMACFSFYPTKGLGAFGDGGMIVTSRKEIYEKVQMLRDYGRKGRYEHIIKGYNSRLDTIQAVVLSAKLKHLDEWNRARAKQAEYYRELLKGIKGVEPFIPKDNRTHVYQTFAVRIKNVRDQVCEQMQQKGIGALIHYPIPLHLQQAYADLGYKKGDFPVSETLSHEVLSLPMFPHITQEQIDAVCDALKEILGKA